MKGFVAGVAVSLIGVAAVLYTYFAVGFAPVATSAPAMPFEARLARLALHARIDKEMPKTVPLEPSESNYSAGARLYGQHCAVCHGLPGREPTAIARGMFPKPPHLFQGKGVTDDTPNETYWKIANGIRLTGMPGFEKTLSSTEMWQMALLLANADKLPPSAKAVLAGEAEPPAPVTPVAPAR
ncbi:MAG TPA: cytochrome c [Vicinamibacteria bacterium]|nr:cytochrome c [Vicinamibacteria bacterium]